MTRIPTLVLGLALTLVPVGAVADEATPPPPAATATERPDYCPDAPAPCAGFEDEYIDNGKPLELDPDGRPVICPPYPAVCGVPGYEDGPPYPQNVDVDGNPQPTAPAPTPTETTPVKAPAPVPQRTDARPGLPKTGV